MRLITDSHAIVAQIVFQKLVEEAPEAAEVAAAATEPEVITAKKPAEGEEGAAAPAAGAKAAPAPKAAAPGAAGAPKKEEKKK
jgi:hypothetical protein